LKLQVLKIFIAFLLFLSSEKLLAQCSADFKVLNLACDGSAVLFKANDSSASLKYYWNFGDKFSGFGNVDSIANPAHLFTSNGTYTITLIVNDTNGCKDTVVKTIRVFDKPIADFKYTNACNNLITSFSDASKSDTGDFISNWNWTFGNSSNANTQNPNTVYSSAGNYQVRLIVTAGSGCKDTLTKTLAVFKKPTATSNLKTACQNGQINFAADTIKQALSYTWDFGDSSFFKVRNASHVYSKSGYYYPLLEVDFGTVKCKIKVDSVFITRLPDASFTINKDTQCFSKNSVCIKLNNSKQKLKLRTLIFDDGSFDDTTPLTDSLICHNYTDTKGGTYFLTLDLIDSNNCISSYTATKPVVIYPLLKADHAFTGGIGCFKTIAFFVNRSNLSPPTISKFVWDFGDGTKDSVNWTNFNHIYTNDGNFSSSITITDQFGCVEKHTSKNSIRNTSFIVDAHMDSSSGICRTNNVFFFKQTPISGGRIVWNFIYPDSSNSFSPRYSFRNAGIYFTRVTVSKNGCDSSIVLDSIVVHGPQAGIGNITNRYQCQIKDTVYFTNATYAFRNKSLSVFWDAGDVFGPNCISSSKDSLNLNKNCNYSRDSLFFKHKYQKGKENCYYVKLVVKDTVIGCSDSVYEAIPLMAPQAKGLFTPTSSSACPGPEYYKALSFDLNQSQPACLKYAWWLMWDSMAAIRTGNFDSNWSYRSVYNAYNYYPYAGDSNGNVTVGLIVENGLDTNGKVCRDTGWFHNVIQVIRLNPMFVSNYNPKKYYCPNSSIRFIPVDSNQTAGTRFIWNFGDGQFLNTTNQNSVLHTYKKGGKYRVLLSVFGANGCRGDTAMWLNIGVAKNFSVSSALNCIGDSAQIVQYNRYYDTVSAGYNYWSDPLRAAAGKEQVLYDLGDGNGFKDIGPNPKISYPFPGSYPISMAVRDSAGCWDTILSYYTIRYSGIYAGFTLPDDSILCAQTLDLKSAATTVDSTVMKGLAGDFIKSYTWDFGSKYAKSFIANPRRYFAIGNYTIKLKVENSSGCKDSITKDLVLIGPNAKFDFVGDSVGCEPLSINFKNQSTNASDYIWQFNDKSKSAFGTDQDTNIVFSYRGQGTFYPQLIARGLFTKNGISQVCDDIYPDTSLSFKRSVTVWELPKPEFIWKTDCSNSTTSFTNRSTISTGSIVSLKWDFGDGTTSTSQNPVHTYADTGFYKIVLHVVSDHGCEDSLVRTVVVSVPPFANFRFNQVCEGTISAFTDSSIAFNDKIYLWNWDFGDATGSNLKNPGKLYAKDTVYSVKLKVTNVAGCSDSIVKTLTVYSKPKPSFTFTTVCDQTAMNFANSSSSKQTINQVLWDFGDTDTASSWNSNHTYATSGTYTVKLVLSTVWGCKDSALNKFPVYPNPIAGIDINQKQQCFRYHNFVFTDSSKILSGNIYTNWDFGDGKTDTFQSLNHKYVNDGNFSVRLIAISNFNCRDTAYDSVSVYTMPQAKFTIDQKEQCFRNNIFTFTDTGKISNGTFTRVWEFGDATGAVNNPTTHSYSDTGIFAPTLILTSNFGCKDTFRSSVQLWPMPVSSFVINDTGQCLNNNSFLFTNTSKIAWGNLSYDWFLGDGTTSNSDSTILHSYSNDSFFSIKLAVTSSKGCIDSIRKIVLVHSMPQVSFTIADSLQCLSGNQFNFTNTSRIAKGSLTYKWNFGDANRSAVTNPIHTYTNFGTYDITLEALSDFGCIDSTKQSVTIYPMPVVKPFSNSAGACINNQSLQFFDSSIISSGTLTRRWDFGDSTTSTLQNPLKTFALAKVYRVWLYQNSDKGCIDSTALDIDIFPKPLPSFSANDTDQCLNGNNFIFRNTGSIASGSVNSTWFFGDGGSSMNFMGFHSYAGPGNYRVNLVSQSNNGCIDSFVRQVVVYPMPVVTFTTNLNEQCIRGNQFVFTNNSNISNGTLDHYWTFGDTGTSKSVSPKYVYPQIGSYIVWLKSVSKFGCTDSVSDFVIVNPMPVSNFSINDTTQCLNSQNFVFRDSSSIAFGIMSRVWTFDDTTSSTLFQISKTFKQDTVHSIKLVQTSNRGCKDSISKLIEVYSKPIPAFSINDTDQCLKQNNFVFNNLSSIRKGNLSYRWKFGDNTFSGLTSPAHRYFAVGNYMVTLIDTSDKGCIDSLKKSIRVDAMPLVSYTVNDTGQCINNQSFIFTNNSSISVGTLQYLWKFGDGNTSALGSPVIQYAKDSVYRVLLTATSNKGCKDSAAKFVDVYPKPTILFDINDSIQCLYLNSYFFENKAFIKYGSLSHTWRYGDASVDNNLDGSHQYATHGDFTVSLKSISNLGCVDSASKVITVGAMPSVKYDINDAGQCFRIQNFVYTNTSTLAKGTMTFKWYFGDNDTLSALNASHVYKSLGNFKPKLIATTNYGCKDSLIRNIWVNPNAKAFFTTNDSDQCKNQQNYVFTDASSVSLGQIKSLLWNLGNNQTATQQQVKGYYARSGTYKIILQTTTDSGCIDSFSNSIKVYPKPAAWFDVNDSAQCLFGNDYEFTDISFDSLGVNNYDWNINNESSQTTKIATFSFVTPGYKTITLIATSLKGCADTTVREVYVKPMPDPTFEKLKAYYCEKTGPYSFVPATPGGTFFGKNIQANQYNPILLWEDSVKYVVTVNGCTDSSMQITTVYPGPVADLGNDTTLCKYESIELLLNSWSSKYLWNTGSDRPSIRVLTPGIYAVMVTNICGMDYDTIRVDFRDVNCRFFLPTAFTPNDDGINDRYKPVIYGVTEMEYEIFSRWGELLYRGNATDNGWDGTYQDAPVQEDAYLIYVHYTYPSGVRYIKLEQKASFVLMR
jgi:gliding motility-associated-like protein